MGIYVKTSSGAECLEHSFNLAKTAKYSNTDNYNLKNAGSTGTEWNSKVWDDIGLTYVVDTSKNRNYFIIPLSGILITHCSLAIANLSSSLLVHMGAILRINDISENILKSRLGVDFYPNFIWFQKVNKGDKLDITIIHLHENPITCSGKYSCLNFLLFS